MQFQVPTTLLPTFWSVQVPEAGVPIVLEDEESKIHITTVCLGENAKPSKPVTVQLISDDGEGGTNETVICVLEGGRKEQERVNLIISDDVSIKHNAGKDVKIYLNGTQYLDFSAELAEQDDIEMETEKNTAKRITENNKMGDKNKQKNAVNIKLGDKKKQKIEEEMEMDEEEEEEEEEDGGIVNQMEQDDEEVEDDEEEEEEEVDAAPKLVQLKAKSKGAKSAVAKEQKKEKQQNEEPVTDGKKKKEKKKKEVTALEEEKPDNKNKGKKRGADTGIDKEEHAKKSKSEGSQNIGVNALVDKYLDLIVEYLKKQGKKAKLEDIGSNVKKPQDMPKGVKLRKLVLRHPEKFDLDVKQNIVKLK
eukprot:TRINITY_DN398_c0_g1_i4.p1 TRINITY_DN398_c0_g1~~TRINITY_DN398_c0_g1_i4.p1  ORF type:complete len:362 (+),score=106.16 TRINITY_DN398_c0_g1_i4:201-1286(+)